MEQIDIFDEEFRPIEPRNTTIDVVHQKGLWHQTFACWLVNPKENILFLQLRGKKNRIGPNTFDATASGHLSSGEKPIDGFREAEEELRVAIRDNEMLVLAQAVHFNNPNTKYKDGSSNYPLMNWAVEYNRPVAVSLLLRNDYVFSKCPQGIGQFLIKALSSGRTFCGEYSCAKLLIKAGANVMQTDSNGESAFMKIIKNDIVHLFDEIRLYRLDKPIFTNEGEPISLYAAKHASNKIISELLSWCFNPKDKTKKQETILHILSPRSNKEEFIQQVIDKGVDVNAVDALGNTALHYACQNAQYKNVELLLNAGAYPLAVNLKEEKPLDKLKHTTVSDYKAIAKTSALLSEAMNNAYEKIIKEAQQSPQFIASQKPHFNSDGNSQHSLD